MSDKIDANIVKLQQTFEDANMISDWANYVLLKEKQGQNREITLQQIETKFGLQKRQEIEAELAEE